jgi:hypothetical protein
MEMIQSLRRRSRSVQLSALEHEALETPRPQTRNGRISSMHRGTPTPTVGIRGDLNRSSATLTSTSDTTAIASVRNVALDHEPAPAASAPHLPQLGPLLPSLPLLSGDDMMQPPMQPLSPDLLAALPMRTRPTSSKYAFVDEPPCEPPPPRDLLSLPCLRCHALPVLMPCDASPGRC